MKKLSNLHFVYSLTFISMIVASAVANTAKPNVIFFSADDFKTWVSPLGYSHAKTPNLDALATSGTRFTAAYTHSPLCVPARTAFATGRYAHETGSWDNASPYDGSIPSWGHRLIEQGHHVRSIGKLHYRSADDSTGFSESGDNTGHLGDCSGT